MLQYNRHKTNFMLIKYFIKISISMLSQETSFKTTLVSTVELVTDISISSADLDRKESHFCHSSIDTFFSYSSRDISGSGIRL